MTTEQQLLNAGIKPHELARSLILQYVCFDIGSMYSFDIEEKLKKAGTLVHKDKMLLNKIKKYSLELSKSLDKGLNSDMLSEEFGDIADFMQKCIDILFDIPVDKRMQAISTLKLLVKPASGCQDA